ncbi:hypothetical protein HOD61_01845 [archaeon]|jgi:hypothetical protein|nr:hypothetical protein [archaeon]
MSNDVFSALSFVKREGPVLPGQLAKELNTNILLASAILSELVEKKQVLITKVKKGGSPLYFIRGQEEKLQQLSVFLGVIEKEVYEKLKSDIIIRDKFENADNRVALRRELKDFAIPLNVKLGNEYELFWKWYLADNELAKEKIKESLSPTGTSEEVKEPEKPVTPIQQKEEKPLAPPEQKEEIAKERDIQPIEEVKTNTGVKEIDSYFSENKMYVISKDVVRKERELNFVVDLPSNIGRLRYFVKFKAKKNINDADLISASDEARSKKLPVLFLSNGDLTKKAQKYLNDNVSGQLVFRNI